MIHTRLFFSAAFALLSICFAGHAANAPGRQLRLLAVTSTSPVVLDGHLDEPAWQKCKSADRFTVLDSASKSAAQRTTVKALTDGRSLFVGFECRDTNIRKLLASERPRDGQVYLDDSVEIVIDPDNQRNRLFHFALNAAGSQFDSSATIRGNITTEDEKWNGSWKAVCTRGADAWFAEVGIPFADLGIESGLPRSIGINFCRTLPRKGTEYSSWSPCSARFMEPDSLGEMILPDTQSHYFCTTLPIVKEVLLGHAFPTLRIENHSGVPAKLRYEYELQGPPPSAPLTGKSEPVDVPADRTVENSCPATPAVTGPTRLVVRLYDCASGRLLHVLAHEVAVNPELEIMALPHTLYSQIASAQVMARHPDAHEPGSELLVRLVSDESSRTLQTFARRTPLKKDLAVAFQLDRQTSGHIVWQAELRRREKTLAQAAPVILSYSSAPKVGIRADGLMQMDGRPFFPIGMYTLQDRKVDHDKVMSDARAAGFNTTVFYAYTGKELTPLLDAAARNGLKAFVYVSDPYRIRRGQSTRAELLSDIDARSTHPAMLGWYLVDEPEGIGEASEHTVRSLYNTVKETDADHPCSLVIMSPAAARLYSSAADIVWVDPYPIPDLPVTYVSECLDGTIKAAGKDKPVWGVLQAFDWNVWRKGSIDKVHRPTPEEERCMTYLALVHGAKGIIYWSWGGSKYYMGDFPEQWRVMKGIAGELRELTPVLAGGKDNGAEVRVVPRTAPLDTMVKQLEDEYYLFAVNRTEKPCEAALRLKLRTQAGMKAGTGRERGRAGIDATAEVLFENRSVPVKAHAIRDRFSPLAVHVYRVKLSGGKSGL